MQFGLQMPAHGVNDPKVFYPLLAEAAAEGGFSSLWVGDHLLWRHPRLETTTLLGLVAGCTDLTLGTGVLVAPLRNPSWTAKTALTLDRLTDGRFILGLGAGGEYAPEFQAAGVPVAGRGMRLDETIETCRRAWAGNPAGLAPRPVNGDVPIWLAGRTSPALRRVARRGDGWIGLFLMPDAFAERLVRLRTDREHAGVTRPLAAAMMVWTAADDDPRRAVAVRDAYVEADYGLPADRLRPYVPAGDPVSVAAELARYARAGAETLILHMASDQPLDQIRLFGQSVLPAVLEHLGQEDAHGAR